MEPSYNNGFSGSETGGQGLSQPGVSGAPIVSGGDAMPGGGSAMPVAPAPINSGAGDVVLAPAAGGRGPKKGLIIGIIAGVLALVLMVVLGMWTGGVFGGGGSKDMGPLRQSFNKYVNYIISGQTDDYGMGDGLDDIMYFYFEDVQEVGISDYLKTADSYFGEFAQSYYDDDGEYNLNNLAAFVQGFASVRSLTEDDILEMYYSRGESSTLEEIEKRYASEYLDENLNKYLDVKKEIAIMEMGMAKVAASNGCETLEIALRDCSDAFLSGRGELLEKENSADELVGKMRLKATTTLKNIYKEIYGADDD